MNIASLQTGLAQAIGQMPVEDRLVVLANIHQLKPAETAEKIALSCAASTEEDERVAAIVALGKIGTQPAFFAVLQAVGEKSPRVSRIAAAALASMNYPAADTELLAMLKGDSSPAKVLAIKAVVVRQIPGASEILIDTITGSDASAAKEAVKSLYFIATIDDLRALCTKAAATEDAAKKKSLSGLTSKLATRLDTDEARELVAPLK
jgi:HEAT repeat protein